MQQVMIAMRGEKWFAGEGLEGGDMVCDWGADTLVVLLSVEILMLER